MGCGASCAFRLQPAAAARSIGISIIRSIITITIFIASVDLLQAAFALPVAELNVIHADRIERLT
jgi:hypothetical protein